MPNFVIQWTIFETQIVFSQLPIAFFECDKPKSKFLVTFCFYKMFTSIPKYLTLYLTYSLFHLWKRILEKIQQKNEIKVLSFYSVSLEELKW